MPSLFPLVRCYFSTEYERFKLLRLLSLLRMDNVIKNLQGYQVFKPKDVNLNHMVVEVEQDQPEEEKQKLLHETECAKKKAEKSPSKLESQKKRKRISAGSEQAEKLTKRCPICQNDIAASGKGWRYPFYSHLARRHFSSQLLRDYISPDLKCLVCGKDGQSFSGPSKQGQLIAHLGGKHRLIEKYIDLDDNGDLVVKKTKKLKKTPSDATKSDRRVKEREEVEAEQGRVKRKRVLPLRYQEKTEDGSRSSQKPASPPGSLGEIPCRYCDQKFMKQAVVQSHLLSTHFRSNFQNFLYLEFYIGIYFPGKTASKPSDRSCRGRGESVRCVRRRAGRTTASWTGACSSISLGNTKLPTAGCCSTRML